MKPPQESNTQRAAVDHQPIVQHLRWKVTLVDRMQYYRRPRTKKRRILRKWRKRPENYRPLMVPVGHVLLMGALAQSRAIPSDKPSPYWNAEDPSRPRIMEMHTKLWEKVQAEAPEFAALCDVFRRVETVRNGIKWSEDVPFLLNAGAVTPGEKENANE